MSLFFFPFALACLLLIGTCTFWPERIYEYPYFMAATFTVFILPQAYCLYRNNSVSYYVETTFFMCLLCCVACWVGYQPKAHPALLEKLNIRIDRWRFLHGGILMVAVGAYFTYRFGSLPEEELSSTMTGIGTIYLFFGGLVYPGFAICFYCALTDRGSLAWIATAFAALIPLQAAIFYGRREPTALFILSLGITLFFVKGLRPPRLLVLAVLVASMLIIPATGQYRSMAAIDPIAAFKQTNFTESFLSYFDPEATSELKNACVLIAATEESGDYGWGADYWNRVVFRFVPAQFVGEDLKDSLMIGGAQRDWGEFVSQSSSFELPPGSTVTGIADAFNQFGYLGCLVFAAIGYLFKNLWTAAIQPTGTVSQVLYVQVTTSAMRALTHQTVDFLPGFIYGALFVGLVALYAKERGRTGNRVPITDRGLGPYVPSNR